MCSPGFGPAILHNRQCMFTWVCPRCGGAVDVADEKCPRCSGSTDPESTEATIGGLQVPVREPPVQLTERRAPAAMPPGASEAVAGSPAEGRTDDARAVAAGGLQVGRKHYLIFAGPLAGAIVGAVWLAGGFSGIRFEDPGELSESPVQTFAIGARDDIEVSAVRPYYDAEYQTRVKAFVANHSKRERSVALRVLLRVREASPGASPIATFDVITEAPLLPNEGREYDVSLKAMGTLQSFPRWDEMRVDLATIGALAE